MTREADKHVPGSTATARQLDQAKIRMLMVVAVFLLGYLAVSLRLVDLTLLRHKSVDTAAALPASEQPLRGSILDRNGELLATSLRMPSVYADTTLVDNPRAVAHALAGIIKSQSEDALYKKLSEKRKFIWIERNITPRQEYAINALGQPGLSFQEEYKRIYPHGNLTSHLVGYTDIDGHGIAGLERQYDKTLAEGEDDLQTTIDIRIQHVLHRELEKSVREFSAKAGVGIVADVHTGEILAMVSLPDFDPYNPGAAPADARFNRATLGVFEMGSTFKLFSMAAALNKGTATLNSHYDASQPIHYGRFTISDYHGKNRVLSLPEVFIYSSNIGTSKMTLETGIDALRDFYEKLGFFEKAPIDIAERGDPLYPHTWREINALTASYGHGIAVSPVHVIRAASMLVNGGLYVTPTLTKRATPAPHDGERVIRAGVSADLRKILELVVAAGSGSKARVEGYDIGGKTGTADKTLGNGYNSNARLSSFIGVFPVEDPKYAVLAILDEPQGTKETYGFATGGWTAAPVVGSVIEKLATLYDIPPTHDPNHDILREMAPYMKDSKKGQNLVSIGTDR
jgi:cell division protein FtsI (penicillin-binding protein 3)